MTPKEQLKKFVEQKGINYYVGTQEDNMDFVRHVAQRAGWRGAIPYLIALDTNGNVINIKKGFASEEYVKSVIDYALNKTNQTAATATKAKEANSSQKAAATATTK